MHVNKNIWAGAWRNQQNDLCAKTQISLATRAWMPSLIRVFSVHTKQVWVLPTRRTVKSLIRLGAQVILLVLSCCGSFQIKNNWINWKYIYWAASSEFGTHRLCEQPAHPRCLTRIFTARSYKQWVKTNLQTEGQIPGPSEWLDMRS